MPIEIKEGTDLMEELLQEFTQDPSPAPKNSSPEKPIVQPDLGVIEDPIGDSWQKLDFESPVELLAILHPAINNHTVILHKWQAEVGEQLAAAKATSIHPYKYCLCAANGSGKDAFVIAPFAMWFVLTKIRSLVVITSASGVQLTNQTENYIRALGTRANNFYRPLYGKDIVKVNQRSIKSGLTGSEIVMFSTDEEGRAEGYHPLEPNAEMAIIVNEAKTVPPPIFRALRRCTGFNYWLNVSTPGEPHGDFYKSFKNWPNKRRVTYFDCPHQSPDEFETDRHELGEHSLLFRSKWLALFTSVSSNTVVSQLAIEKLRDRIKDNLIPTLGKHWPLRFGIDLAAGGDENVVSIWRGNTQLEQVTFREEDVFKTADRITQVFLRYKISKDHDYLFADDGGIGKAIIQVIRKDGWNIKRILNQSAPRAGKNDYKNRGMELWYRFSRFVELGYIKPLEDEKMWSQIGSRHYKRSTDAPVVKLQLESKQAEIAEGHNSPDRADAAVLAFTDVTIESLTKLWDGIEVTPDPVKKGLSPEEVNQKYEEMVLGEHAEEIRGGKSRFVVGSLSAMIKQQSRARYAFTGNFTPRS